MILVKNWLLPASICLFSTLALWISVLLPTIYQNFDGPYYLVVAKTWYDPETIGQMFSFPLPLEYYAAHFPGYPFLINLVARIPGINHLQSMLAVNLIASVLATVVLYEVARRLKWGNPLWITLAWLFWWPRMWVSRSVGSPETLFILFVIASLYAFQKQKYLWAGLAGAGAVLTKSPGILLFVAYGVWFIVENIKSRKLNWKIWPVLLIPTALLSLFYFYFLQTGDFWAYFNSGDNIHLQALPFRVFNSNQSWVGDWWLSDVLWIYLVGGVGVYLALRRNLIWGLYGLVFYLSILFVSHRDIERYSLPLVPVVLLGLAQIFDKRPVQIAIALMTVPLFFYSVNFLAHNTVMIANWGPFL